MHSATAVYLIVATYCCVFIGMSQPTTKGRRSITTISSSAGPQSIDSRARLSVDMARPSQQKLKGIQNCQEVINVLIIKQAYRMVKY